MLFPTLSFAAFFLAVFVGFWYVFRRSPERKALLIVASYVFYAFWDWRYCPILLLSTAANYGFGLLVGSSREYRYRKVFLVLSVVFNLLLLGFFKYYNFFAEQANGLLRFFLSTTATGPGGASPAYSGFLFPALNVILPVGISFYTFKSMSYVFDVYLCKLPAVRSFADVMLYVSFFPQLASGPIVSAARFIPQIEGAVTAGVEPGSRPIEFDRASVLLVSGLTKKLVLANFLSTLLVDPVLSSPASHNALEVFLALLGYSGVIYADFSGYSDMAIAVALLLGFHTPANFNRPYIAHSVTDFWKRWHITFSGWLRDYLYFSMGGSRFGLARNVIALFFTMVLGGLWHGASLVFVVWGAMQGLALALERGFGYGDTRSAKLPMAALQIAGTFAFTTVSWLVFRSASLSEVGSILASLTHFSAPITVITPLVVLLIIAPIACQFIPTRAREFCFTAWVAVPLPVKGVLLALFLSLLTVVSMAGVAPFIYFSF